MGTLSGERLRDDETWTHEIELPASVGTGNTLKVTLAYSDRAYTVI